MSVLLLLLCCAVPHPDDAPTPPADRADAGSDSAEGDSGPADTGELPDPQAIPPGPWEVVAVGAIHACVLREQRPSCFGFDLAGAASPPDLHDLTALSAGIGHTCGLNTEGVVTCWGDDSHGQSTPPDEPFVSIDAGHDHTCGITLSGELRCWGNNTENKATPPVGSGWSTVSAGGYHTIALSDDGRATCWGSEKLCINKQGMAGTIAAAGFQHTVLVQNDGTAICGGSSGEGRCPEGLVVDVAVAGGYHTCGLAADRSPEGEGLLACWPDGSADAPYYELGAKYLSLSAGLTYTCGITLAGEVECWSWTGDPWPTDP